MKPTAVTLKPRLVREQAVVLSTKGIKEMLETLKTTGEKLR